MKLYWNVYALSAIVFLSFALSIHFLALADEAVIGLFVILAFAYAWVSYIMISRAAVLELHSYTSCKSCDAPTPSQGQHCMVCGVKLAD